MIVVSGYHGYGNLGDEAILAVLCEGLAAQGVSRDDIFVLSGDVDYSKAVHGVQAVPRYDFRQVWQLIGQADLLVSGGGSLFQDVTSKRTIPYYLGILEMAFRQSVPVALYGHGIGPIGTLLYHKPVARAFRKSAGFTVRDAFSAEFLNGYGVPVSRDAFTVDPVFAWESTAPELGSKPIVGLNLRPYPGWDNSVSTWVELLRTMLDAGCGVRFMPIGPGDVHLGKVLKSHVPDLEIKAPLTLERFRDELGQLDAFISMRLHGVILGALSGTIPVGLNYDPKIHAVCEQLGCRRVELVELGLLPPIIRDVLENHDRHGEQQNQQLALLRSHAQRNQDMIRDLLQRVV